MLWKVWSRVVPVTGWRSGGWWSEDRTRSLNSEGQHRSPTSQNWIKLPLISFNALSSGTIWMVFTCHGSAAAAALNFDPPIFGKLHQIPRRCVLFWYKMTRDSCKQRMLAECWMLVLGVTTLIIIRGPLSMETLHWHDDTTPQLLLGAQPWISLSPYLTYSVLIAE